MTLQEKYYKITNTASFICLGLAMASMALIMFNREIFPLVIFFLFIGFALQIIAFGVFRN